MICKSMQHSTSVSVFINGKLSQIKRFINVDEFSGLKGNRFG